MATISMNLKDIKTSDSHRLLLILSDERNVKRSDKYVALWNLSMEKYKKDHTKTKRLKY